MNTQGVPEQSYPKYRALWPPYRSVPHAEDGPAQPTLLRKADLRFDAWAPAPGNATPSWTFASTRNINAGVFAVGAGGWFDPGDHPNPELYYILQGTLHLSNPDSSQLVELRAGDAAAIPGFAYHHGYNFGDEDCRIAWWVPGEMHTDLFKQKVENDTLYELGWYERKPVVFGGAHDRNEGFPSRLDQLEAWPAAVAAHESDMVSLPRERWLRLIAGDEPRRAYLRSFFYADAQIRGGELRLPGRRDTKPETQPFEQVLHVVQGELVVALTGTTDVLRADPGDVIFLPAGVEHSYMALGADGARAVFGMSRAAAAGT